MKHTFLLSCLFSLFLLGNCYAEKVIWSGKVNSNGEPTPLISLTLHQRYQIKATGVVNLGKWIQNGDKLANDSCYEFSTHETPKNLVTLRNSHDISICTGPYRSTHDYQSKPFIAQENKIFFWLHDIDYEDNYGSLDVQVIQVENIEDSKE